MDDPRDLSRYRGTENARWLRRDWKRITRAKTISSVALGRKMFQQAMAEKPDIDAIFCTNDDRRLACCWSVRHSSTMCREKMAIAGFHGLEIGRAGCKNRQRDYTTL